MAVANIYQIYYDQKSRQVLDPAFIPLDNTANERPDWYEFWVIRNWLKTHQMDEGQLYGFLSPSFMDKTGLRGSDLLNYLGQAPAELDVVTFSHGWDQIAYFKNVFEQGEYCHPGLLAASQNFFTAAGCDLDLTRLTGHSMNSVFSNYFVAKPKFWREWLLFADKLWEIAEHQTGDLADALNSSGAYLSGGQDAALKVFVQERIASILFETGAFVTVSIDISNALPVNNRLFLEDMRTRKLLTACDTLKLEFSHNKNEFFNNAYWQCRSAITFNDFHKRAGETLWAGRKP